MLPLKSHRFLYFSFKFCTFEFCQIWFGKVSKEIFCICFWETFCGCFYCNIFSQLDVDLRLGWQECHPVNPSETGVSVQWVECLPGTHKELICFIEAVIFVDIKSIMLFSCPLQVYKLGTDATSFQILGFGFQSYTVCSLRILNILCVEQAEYGSQKESLFWAGTQNTVESGPPGCLGTIPTESEGNEGESVWRCVSKTLCSLERKTPPQRKNSRER